MIMTYAVSSFALAGAVAMAGPPGGVDENQVIEELRAQISSLQGQVNELRRSTDDQWLTEQRGKEIRTLVTNVLSDADARASLLAQSATAGHDGKFFLASADGTSRLEIGGHFQGRYIYNSRDGSAADPDEFGFSLRRAKLKGKGHIGDPKIGFGFSIVGDADSMTGDGHFEDYYAEYTYDNGVKVRVGRWKQPFARVNITSSSKQLAVERSLANEAFNVDRSEGIMVSQKNDTVQWAFSFNDGIDGQNTDWDSPNSTDFGLTGRVDFLIDGTWKQMGDFAAWSGEDDAAFLGTAIHYQQGESDGATDGDDLLLLTVDGSYESNGIGLFGAFYYSEVTVGATSAENMGLEFSASMMIDDTYEPFIRFEYLDFDDMLGMTKNQVNIVTLGVNIYQKKHASKFTVDIMFVLDHLDDDAAALTLSNPSASLGLLNDPGTEDGQVAVRAQYQLTF